MCNGGRHVPLCPASANEKYIVQTVSLNHDGTDGTGIQSVSPIPSASAAGLSVPSFSNSRSNQLIGSLKAVNSDRPVLRVLQQHQNN